MPGTTGLRDQNVIIITKARQKPEESHHRRKKGSDLLTILLSILALIALAHILFVTHQTTTAAPPTDCMGLIRTTDYAQALHLQAHSQEMGAVQFVSQLFAGQPAALVQVTNSNAQHTLDVYIYGCRVVKQHPQLTLAFTQRGLVQGTVALSQQNTLITSEVDTSLPADASALLQPLQQNVYREYAWRNGAFVQVAFPALYPVTSRSEAEALQQEANDGQSLPWSDPLATAEQMAKDIFNWPTLSTQDTIQRNDGITAQVQLVQQSPQMQVAVTLERLVQHDSKGLWFVVGAKTAGLTMNLAGQAQDSPPQVPVTSPIMVQGTGALTDGQTSTTLFDHTLTPVSLASSEILQVNANGTFSASLSYANIAHNQQGLLLIQSVPLPTNYAVEPAQLLLIGVILG